RTLIHDAKEGCKSLLRTVRRGMLPSGFFVSGGTMVETAIEPMEITFDAYTMCSFVPTLGSSRAIPLLLIGYRHGQDPSFVWLVPREGISSSGLTEDPYYAKVLRDPR